MHYQLWIVEETYLINWLTIYDQNMTTTVDQLCIRIDEIIAQCELALDSWVDGPNSMGMFQDQVTYMSARTQAIKVLESILGANDGEVILARRLFNDQYDSSLKGAIGILNGTKILIESGFLFKLSSKIRVEIKGEFLSTAQQLARDGDKDPAAVLACCVLEDSVKQLARKNEIQGYENMELSVLANSLAANGAIENTTRNSIHNFKPLRNAALHANWAEVVEEQVNQLLAFLPVFIERELGK